MENQQLILTIEEVQKVFDSGNMCFDTIEKLIDESFLACSKIMIQETGAIYTIEEKYDLIKFLRSACSE